MSSSTSTSSDPVAVHGWTAVPREPNAILGGKEYIHKPQPLLVKDIKFPSDDPLVVKAQEYAREKLAPQTYNHSMRVYYFVLSRGKKVANTISVLAQADSMIYTHPNSPDPSAILQQQFPSHARTLSASTLALTSLLHDIGTTHTHLRATRLSFEFYGGLLALDLVGTKLGGPAAQAEAVAEAVIRHQDLGTVGTITLLGQLIQLATIYDNVGEKPEIVHKATRDDVNREFPRGGWAKCFADTVKEEMTLKPWAHSTHLGEEDFPNAVLGNTLMAEYD